MSVTSYIRKSPTGFYSYRRRIPDDCRKTFGKRELQRSLKTKKHSEALLKAAQVNAQFEAEVASIRGEQHSADVPSSAMRPVAVHDAIMQATEILMNAGIHPKQRPDYQSTQQQIQAYEEGLDLLESLMIDGTTVGYDPRTMETQYRDLDPANPLDQAYLIATEGDAMAGEPTLEMAATYYLEWSQEDKQRTAYDQRKFEQAQWRATDRLAEFLGGGIKERGYTTPLKDMSRPLMLRYWRDLEKRNPTWKVATYNKEIGRLKACFSKANSHFDLSLSDPFDGLRKKESKREKIEKRRSFSPTELDAYVTALSKKHDELRLIGLLMIGTGCRTKEIAGLTRGEVCLGRNIPFIQIRHNHIRNVKNDNSERDVPLVGRCLDALRGYLAKAPETDDPSAPLFPRYGRDGGTDAVSQTLNRIIREELEVSDRKLVAYSTRHTMQDKLRAVEAPPHLREEIMGREHESSTAQGYGDGNLLSTLQRELAKADSCTQWGRYELTGA
jgi:integrase